MHDGVAAKAKLDIMQKTAELVTTSEDDPFPELDDEFESNEVVVEDDEKMKEAST